MRIKVLKPIPGYTEGREVEVDDVDGIPTSSFWRRRLRDAAIDGCCEVVKSRSVKKSSKVAEAKDDNDH